VSHSQRPLDTVLAKLEALGPVNKTAANSYQARCPAHDDRDPSLSISTASDERVLIHCHAGCSYADVVAALGLQVSDLFTDSASGAGVNTPVGEPERVYRYVDETWALLSEVCRYPDKRFRQRRPDPSAPGGFSWGLDGVRRVPYRLPDVCDAAESGGEVWVVEGEKDADRLVRLGLVATTSPMGAGKWRDEYAEHFRGVRRAYVLPDDDTPGRRHAAEVARSLAEIVPNVRVVELYAPPGESKRDVYDFLAPAADVATREQAKRLLVDLGEKAPGAKEWCGRFVSGANGSALPERISTPREGLQFQLLADVVDEAPAEPEWFIDGYLAPGTLTLLAGRPKVGKSTLLFALLEALAAGNPFLGRATRPTGCLLLTEERSGTIAEKARRFLSGSGNPLSAGNESVHVLLRHKAGQTPWPEIVRRAVSHCQEHGLGVLVVDVLDKWVALPGDAENSAGATIEALQPLLAAGGEGLAVLIVTHQRKSGGEYGEAIRGSNALAGAVDIIVELERLSRTLHAGDGARVLRAVSRYAGTPDELVATLTEDEYVFSGDTQQVRSDGEKAVILDTLSDEPATAEQVAEASGVAERTVRRHLDTLVGEGRASRTGDGKKGSPYRWRLTDPTASDEEQP
jgi:hypothetical protein